MKTIRERLLSMFRKEVVVEPEDGPPPEPEISQKNRKRATMFARVIQRENGTAIDAVAVGVLMIRSAKRAFVPDVWAIARDRIIKAIDS